MSEDIIINPETIYVIEYLWDYTNRYKGVSRRNRLRKQGLSSDTNNLQIIRHEFLYLDQLLSQIEISERLPIFLGESPDDWYWLTYDDDIEIIPIYSDAIALSQRRVIIRPSEIPNIVSLIVISKTDGVDLENHGFGYHFHLGTIRKNRLNRSDLLLTFDPKDQVNNGEPKPNLPLYSEKHGKNYKRVDASTIGLNRRRPIYDVCHREMQKRGIGNFKAPSLNSLIFFP